jgi:hypothetical protein
MNTSQLIALTTFVLLSTYSLALLRRLLAKRSVLLRRARR